MSKLEIPNAISSNEKSSYWFLIGFGLLFMLPGILFVLEVASAIRKEDYGIFAVLLFPAVGFGIAFAGWKMRQKFLFFGPTPLVPSPIDGQIGGQLGGSIHFTKTVQQSALQVHLACVHTYTSGSGDNKSTHHSTLWDNDSKPFIKPGPHGTELQFCFDVPAGERPTGRHPRKGKISWQVTVEGQVDGQPFKRSWNVPATPGTSSCALKIPSAHKEKIHQEKRQAAEASAEIQIQSEITADGIDLVSEQGRNKTMSIPFMLFGLIFGGVGIGLFVGAFNGEMMLWLMAPIFTAVGFGIFGLGLFLAGRKLECKVIDDTVHVRRSFFGRIIYTRQGKLTSANQLELKETMSSQSGNKRTEYFALYAHVMGENKIRQKLKLVEGIEGKMAAEAIQRKIEEALNSGLNDELGL